MYGGWIVRVLRLSNLRPRLFGLVKPLTVGPGILETGGGCPFGAARHFR